MELDIIFTLSLFTFYNKKISIQIYKMLQKGMWVLSTYDPSCAHSSHKQKAYGLNKIKSVVILVVQPTFLYVSFKKGLIKINEKFFCEFFGHVCAPNLKKSIKLLFMFHVYGFHTMFFAINPYINYVRMCSEIRRLWAKSVVKR